MKYKILIWDNDDTVTSSENPNDNSINAKVILPNVEKIMCTADFNFIISGFKSPESEMQNFDPEQVTATFVNLMEKLPINAAAFSPSIGGVACYVVIKRFDNSIYIKKAHEDPRYQEFIGQFKKPGIGMFVVIKDIAQEEFGQIMNKNNSIMIGDTWHDEVAANDFGLSFIDAKIVHQP